MSKKIQYKIWAFIIQIKPNCNNSVLVQQNCHCFPFTLSFPGPLLFLILNYFLKKTKK